LFWERQDIKPGNSVPQAGVVLVEQALFADATSFPKTAVGQIKVPDKDGRVEIRQGKSL
jgi:hypothetical protein